MKEGLIWQRSRSQDRRGVGTAWHIIYLSCSLLEIFPTEADDFVVTFEGSVHEGV